MIMELERTPHPGQVWQHFKGNEYRILLCTGIHATPEEWCKLPGILEFKHTETLEQYMSIVANQTILPLAIMLQ